MSNPRAVFCRRRRFSAHNDRCCSFKKAKKQRLKDPVTRAHCPFANPVRLFCVGYSNSQAEARRYPVGHADRDEVTSTVEVCFARIALPTRSLLIRRWVDQRQVETRYSPSRVGYLRR